MARIQWRGRGHEISRKCEAVKQEEVGLLYKDKEPSNLLYRQQKQREKNLSVAGLCSFSDGGMLKWVTSSFSSFSATGGIVLGGG